MKNIFKTISALGMSIALLASCDVDNIKPIYTPSTDGVSLGQSVINDTEIPAAQTTYNVDIVRGTASGSLTVNIDAKLPEGISCPSSVTFADGEFATALPIDISKMEIGQSYKGSIAISGLTEDEAKIAITSASLTFAKAYTWISLGTGFFYDGFWEGFIGECEIFKADGFDRYRVMKPYAESEEAVNAGPAYLEFWVVNDEGNIKYDTFVTPFDYDGAGNFIKGYWPSALSPNYAEKEAYNGFYENDIIVFYPCWYIDGLGGWPSNYYPAVVCLPGRSADSFISWLEENEM